MLSFSRTQVCLLTAAGMVIALSAAIQHAGARLAPPLVLVHAEAPAVQDGGEGPEPGEDASPSSGALHDPQSAPPVPTEPGGARGAGADAGVEDGTGGVLARDLNKMGFDDLVELPGIGPVIAQRILDYRAAHGPFVRVDQLLEVPGIGPARYGRLLPLVYVGPGGGPGSGGVERSGSDEQDR